MGRRVEYILIIAIILVLIIPFTIKIKKSIVKKDNKITKKSSELNNFTEYEINATTLQHTIKASKAEEIKKSWHLKNVEVTTDKIESLNAKRAIVKSDKLELYDNVVAKKRDGTIYKSQKATYNTKNKQLITPEKFTIFRHTDIVKGRHLEYDANKKVTKAKDVNGTFVLKKAKE